MLREIRNFYNKIKLQVLNNEVSEDVPITYLKVFHKEYPRFNSRKLSENYLEESELETLLENRESTREFSDKPTTFEDISKVLNSCRIVDPIRNPEKRTYPSGGARFPVELYLATYNVEGIDGGMYHYNMKESELEEIWKRYLTTVKRDLISPYLENPSATVIFTSVIPRSEVKYGTRAYPYSLIEAGHMGQNIHLRCKELGLGSCSVSGFVEDKISELLDLTSEELPIYTISLGWPKKNV